MMRSLYSGVSGIKVHQTKMDVIGNNIANVNTIGFKSSSVNFADVYYQTSSSATGANAETGAAGTNAKQIGLGSDVAAISVNISTNGGTQRTDRNLDLMINGNAFFIVDSGGQKLFTRSGALGVDVNGTLYNTSNGGTILGWQVDANGNVMKDTVSALSVMSVDRMSSEPTATTKALLSGNIDQNDEQVQFNDTADGFPVTLSFYDNLGNSFMAKMFIMQTASDVKNVYTVAMGDLLNSKGESALYNVTYDDMGNKVYTSTEQYVSLGGEQYTYTVDAATGEITWTPETSATQLAFNGSNGAFSYVLDSGEQGDSVTLIFNDGATENNPFPPQGIKIDFHNLTMYSSGGTSKVNAVRGDADGYGSGNTAGNLSGFTIQSDGKIYGVYNNGDKMLFGQIALATFANPAGLESVGNSLYAASLNSGEFDGIGVDPSSVDGFTTGALEMSNVDLATEFTTMITTQRGFQANSRIITTSDSLLEEIVNLKR